MAEQQCPLLMAPCMEHKCKFYVNLRGKNPQTGIEFDKWDCTIAWLPILLIENSKMQMETGAAIESLRNVVALPILAPARPGLEAPEAQQLPKP